MKFAVISDIHIGTYYQYKGIYRKNTLYSEKYLKKFVTNMNQIYKPEFVVNCGDMVEDADESQDKLNFLKGIKLLAKLNCPAYHVIGNHEQMYLSHKYLEETTKRPKLYYKIDHDDFRLIILFVHQSHDNGRWIDPYIDGQQLKWLKEAVNTQKQVIIFSHASLIPVDTLGNFWFEDYQSMTYIKNYQDYLDVISGHNVVLVINGHLHWNKKQIVNDTPYITVQSLVENTSGKVKGPPANAYALVEISESNMKVDIKGWGGETYTWKRQK